MRHFIGGLLLGTVITLVAGALIGPEITLSNVGSGNEIPGGGRYELLIEEAGGQTCYAIIDTATGVATVLDKDGKTTVSTSSDQEHVSSR